MCNPNKSIFTHSDLSETGRELADINTRYEGIEDRLADRQHELEGMLENVKVYLQELQDILMWLDDTEHHTPPLGPLPTGEDEAQRKLKEHQVIHRNNSKGMSYFK